MSKLAQLVHDRDQPFNELVTKPLNHVNQYIYMYGALAQLGERLLCTQEVSGSIPLGSII